jgi:hypothetical protein
VPRFNSVRLELLIRRSRLSGNVSRTNNRMGLGIVLLFWGIVGVILAGTAAGALAGMVYLFDRRSRRVRRGWLLTAVAMPVASLGYVGVGFVVYATYCEVVRDVDLGIGDSWRVPLGNGYRLVMIDTADQAFVEGPSGLQLHFGLKRIGTAGDVIAGEDEHGLFVINGERHTDETIASESSLRGVFPAGSGEPQLVAPEDFYRHHRWGVPDLLAAVLIVVPPVLLLCALALRFVRSGWAANRPLQPTSGADAGSAARG